MTKKVLYAVLALLVLSQFYPVDHTNPPVDPNLNFQLPDSLAGMLHSACYDCHSFETHWPWYSYVSPVKFWVVDHVNHGRGNLNFSEWYKMSADERQDMKEEIWEEVANGKMPLESYLWMHPEAELIEEQKRILRNWSKSE
jgi:hypothetical protein